MTENYMRAVELRKKMLSRKPELIKKISEFKLISEEFYELMRFKDLNCTDAQYDRLYKGTIYQMEETDGFYSMERMLEFLNALESK